MQSKTWTLGALALATMLTAGAARAGDLAIGAAAPAFTLEDQSGNKVSLADFAGKLVVLEWTNPGCPFVQRHYKAKTMTSLAGKYQAKEVVWLAVNSTKSADKASNAEWAKEQGIGYPILDDHEGVVGKQYGAKSTPHMFIIGKDGKLLYRGAIDADPSGDNATPVNYVDRALGELLEGKPVSEADTKSYGCSVKYAS